MITEDPWRYFTPEPNTGCWLWNAGLTAKGYGSFRGRHAHTVVLEETLGRPLRPGYVACHACDCRPCGNPGHLWEGTVAENTQDMVAKGRNKGAPQLKGPDSPLWRGGRQAATERNKPQALAYGRANDKNRARNTPGTPEHAAKLAYNVAYREARRVRAGV